MMPIIACAVTHHFIGESNAVFFVFNSARLEINFTSEFCSYEWERVSGRFLTFALNRSQCAVSRIDVRDITFICYFLRRIAEVDCGWRHCFLNSRKLQLRVNVKGLTFTFLFLFSFSLPFSLSLSLSFSFSSCFLQQTNFNWLHDGRWTRKDVQPRRQ